MRGAIVVLACGVGAASAHGAVTNGFFEDFAGGSLGGFAANGVSVTNAGTDGVGGAGDGFVNISRAASGRLAARSRDAAYAGDYLAEGVDTIRFWLRDTGAQDDLTIRLGIGNNGNFWVSNASWAPTAEWQVFNAGIANEANWTLVRGSGTFEDALRNADRLQFRHELDPINDGAAADNIAGEFGVDRIAFVPGPGAAASLALPLAGFRRRRR